MRPSPPSAYTVLRAAEAPDFTGEAPGAFLAYARALGSEQLAVNIRVLEPQSAHIAPDGDPSRGHSHRTIEEIYLVLEGEITVKLGRDVVALVPYDAVLIQPATPRAVRNETAEQAAFLMISVKVEDNASESQAYEAFWT